jgi:hypothetical protein
MKDKSDSSIIKTNKNSAEEKAALNPLPVYPPGDDIYNKSKEEEDIDPENLLENKTPNTSEHGSNEKDFDDDLAGEDLDIPGSELDDDDEAIGSEDEENNLYSIGGDNHNDLDEDKDE